MFLTQNHYYQEPSVWKKNVNWDRVKYIHYTAADTRQGFEWQEFPYADIPEDVLLVCDASANFGSKPVDISKYGVIYAAAHKNFSTSGVCYTIIRKDLIKKAVLPGTPTMCNWWKFQQSDNKIYNVPVIFSIWLGRLMTEWMIAKGGMKYFEDLAIKRADLLYDVVKESNGFYRTFVTDRKFMSRMNVVFSIFKSENEEENALLVKEFLRETCEELSWLDIKSHPLGLKSDAIRVTTYNPQPIETVQIVADYMRDFMSRFQNL